MVSTNFAKLPDWDYCLKLPVHPLVFNFLGYHPLWVTRVSFWSAIGWWALRAKLPDWPAKQIPLNLLFGFISTKLQSMPYRAHFGTFLQWLRDLWLSLSWKHFVRFVSVLIPNRLTKTLCISIDPQVSEWSVSYWTYIPWNYLITAPITHIPIVCNLHLFLRESQYPLVAYQFTIIHWDSKDLIYRLRH